MTPVRQKQTSNGLRGYERAGSITRRLDSVSKEQCRNAARFFPATSTAQANEQCDWSDWQLNCGASSVQGMRTGRDCGRSFVGLGNIVSRFPLLSDLHPKSVCELVD